MESIQYTIFDVIPEKKYFSFVPEKINEETARRAKDCTWNTKED